jgi:hypothetical protein
MGTFDRWIRHTNDLVLGHGNPLGPPERQPLTRAQFITGRKPLALPQGKPLTLAKFGGYRCTVLVRAAGDIGARPLPMPVGAVVELTMANFVCAGVNQQRACAKYRCEADKQNGARDMESKRHMTLRAAHRAAS